MNEQEVKRLVPESEMRFAHSIDVAKDNLERSFIYVSEGYYDAAIETLDFLKTYVAYMSYTLQEDKANRIVKGFGEWIRMHNAGENSEVQTGERK